MRVTALGQIQMQTVMILRTCRILDPVSHHFVALHILLTYHHRLPSQHFLLRDTRQFKDCSIHIISQDIHTSSGILEDTCPIAKLRPGQTLALAEA